MTRHTRTSRSTGTTWRRWSRAALVATTLGALVLPAVPARAGAAAPTAEAAVPRIDWQPCPGADGFDCARVRVPLDHDDPRGATLSLALSRARATDPARRIGTLFLNPGGPGGSGVSFVQSVGKGLYSDEVRARFDLVGFDPRGVAGSTPLECFDSQAEAQAASAPFAFPVTEEQEQVWRAADRRYAQACVRRAGAVLDHMSTADVARDMDLLRRAVGDDRTTFAGYSYGSYVGSVYANLFPDKVRAIIIDGVIDPVADATGRSDEWRTLPVDARLESEEGAYRTLREFLRLCDRGGERCAFSGGDPAERYDRLAARLRAQPVELPDGSGGTVRVRYSDLVATTLGALYSPASFPALAEYLQAVDEAADGRRVAAAAGAVSTNAVTRAEVSRADYEQGREGFLGVWCSDSLNPSRWSAWRDSARAADRRFPYFGRAWIFGSSTCAFWPGQAADRYLGPFDKPTAKPLLVVGTLYDPATRYQDAVTTSRTLASARLLTVRGWGHTSLGKSSCSDRYASRYLLTGALPPEGTRCEVDVVPFSRDSAAAELEAAGPALTWRPPAR